MSISSVEKVSRICFLYLICSPSLCLVNLDRQTSLPDSVNFWFIIRSWYGCRLTSMLLYDCNSLSIAKRKMIYYSIQSRLNLFALTLQVQFFLESTAKTLAYSLCKLMVQGSHYPFSIIIQSLLLQLLLETCWNPLSYISFHSACPKFWPQVSSITQHLESLCDN